MSLILVLATWITATAKIEGERFQLRSPKGKNK